MALRKWSFCYCLFLLFMIQACDSESNNPASVHDDSSVKGSSSLALSSSVTMSDAISSSALPLSSSAMEPSPYQEISSNSGDGLACSIKEFVGELGTKGRVCVQFTDAAAALSFCNMMGEAVATTVVGACASTGALQICMGSGGTIYYYDQSVVPSNCRQ